METVEIPTWLGKAIGSGKAYAGRWRALDETIPAVEPGTGRVIGKVAKASPDDITASAREAKAVQRSWATMPGEGRAAIIRRAAALAEQNGEEIVDALMKESGSTQPKAQFELYVTIKALYEAAAMPSQSNGLVLPSEAGRISIARRLPLGVVGVISPFNFPLYLAIRAVAPALAVGNAVVLKPDLRTAISGGVVIARLFEQAGLPAGLLHILPGGADAGEALCSAPDVAMIQFTGSTAAGRRVGEIAGRHLKKLSLELGGKNALIVLEDADIDLAVANASWGAFLHQGQICMASGRIFVQRSIAKTFAEKLAKRAAAIQVGSHDDATAALGPLIGDAQAQHAGKIVSDSVRNGAELLTGGSSEGMFFQPTVLSNVTSDLSAYHEEIFGPVGVVIPFDTDDEVVAMANDTEFGLSAGIITPSIERALSIGERLRVGLLHINDQTVADDVVNPFGGFGASGNGTSIGGPANWEEFTQWQWFTMKGTPPAYPL